MSVLKTSQPLKACRICACPNLISVLDFGILEFTGFFPSSKTEEVPKGEVNLVFCENCGQTQLGHIFEPTIMYGDNYGYMSHLNSGMKNHLNELSQYVVNFIGQSEILKVVDIGSNDGTFLNSINSLNVQSDLIGIDPTILKFQDNYNKNIRKIPELFNLNHLNEIGANSVDLVSTLAMFYDVDDPVSFIENVYNLLRENGFWLIEITYSEWMRTSLAFDTICHEHAVYYNFSQLFSLFSASKFAVKDVFLSETNGKSLVILLQKNALDNNLPPFAKFLLGEESKTINDQLIQWREFGIAVKQKIKNLNIFFEDMKSKGDKVNALGASTKGNILLQVLNLDSSFIEYIGEVNPYKFDRFTPGSRIQIISENRTEIMKESDYLLVLPWHFKSTICPKMFDYVSNGGILIFPLPDLHTYGKFNRN